MSLSVPKMYFTGVSPQNSLKKTQVIYVLRVLCSVEPSLYHSICVTATLSSHVTCYTLTLTLTCSGTAPSSSAAGSRPRRSSPRCPAACVDM